MIAKKIILKSLSIIFGWTLIIFALLLSLYIGCYAMIYTDFINICLGVELINVALITLGVIKIAFCGISFYIFYLVGSIGAFFLDWGEQK